MNIVIQSALGFFNTLAQISTICWIGENIKEAVSKLKISKSKDNFLFKIFYNKTFCRDWATSFRKAIMKIFGSSFAENAEVDYSPISIRKVFESFKVFQIEVYALYFSKLKWLLNHYFYSTDFNLPDPEDGFFLFHFSETSLL